MCAPVLSLTQEDRHRRVKRAARHYRVSLLETDKLHELSSEFKPVRAAVIRYTPCCFDFRQTPRMGVRARIDHVAFLLQGAGGSG
jgi:hypothetical protein